MIEQLTTKLSNYLDESKPCIICGSKNFTLWAREGYLSAMRCIECDMISVNPHFTEEGLDIFYSGYYQNRKDYTELKRLRSEAYRLDRDWISHFAPDGGKVLDIGCSDGSFLSYFDNRKWDRYGIDVTEDAISIASTVHGIQTQLGKVWETDVGMDYDLVMMRGVIEHFTDPVAVLETCMKLLKPGGLLFITATPAGDSFAFSVYREKWRMFTPFEHIHFFSVNHLTTLVERFGGEYIAHHYQYDETPYADPENDFKRVVDDIVQIAQTGNRDQIQISGPFPGSMLTACWRKK